MDNDKQLRASSSVSFEWSREHWYQLSELERQALVSKLIEDQTSYQITAASADQAAVVFATLVTGRGDFDVDASFHPDVTGERIQAARNFIRLAGGIHNSAVWHAIAQITSIWESGMIELVVKDRKKFKAALRSEKFAVNRWWDKIPFVSVHPNDTARQLTETSLHPSLHFANDDSTRPTVYWAHIDARSVYFRRTSYASRLREMYDSARNHRTPSSPATALSLYDIK